MCADLECLLKKMHSRQNNLKKSYTEKKVKYTPSGYSLCTNCSFDCYRGEDCIERFCKDLRDHAMKIINYEEKEMTPLTYKETSLMKSKKFVTYVKRNLVLMEMIKMHLNYTIKSEIIVIITENLEQLLVQVFA